MGGRIDQRADRAAGVAHGLRDMFRKLERRPVPDHIQSVVDQLAADRPAKKAETA